MPVSLKHPRLLAALLLGLALAPAASQAAQSSYEAELICQCFVTALSADGRAAAGQLGGAGQAFHWRSGEKARALGRGTRLALGIAPSGLPALSADGQWVAATILADGRTHATQGRWSAATGWQQLMPPRPADGAIVDTEDGSVFGMSRDGKVVTGLYWRNTAQGGMAHGSHWREGGAMQDMGSSGASSRIDDANADGSVLVGFDEDPVAGGRRAAVWREGALTVLDTGADASEASAVNAAGDVVVGYGAIRGEPAPGAVLWRWNGTTWDRTPLGVMPGTKPGGATYANAVSDDGRVVVGMSRLKFTPVSKGFIWTAETGVVDVNTYLADRGAPVPKAYTITHVMGLSADGRAMAVVASHKRTGAQASYVVRETVNEVAPGR
jgi:uncharacterized membrane protein